jgi:hypothetical protein
VGRPLWREDESVFCTSCWLLTAQCFSGPSPLGLATILYCLIFETFLCVASNDSQGHGGGIRSRLHRSSRLRAEQSSSLLPATSQHGHSWHRTPLGPMAIYLFSVKAFFFFLGSVTPRARYMASARTAQKTPLPKLLLLGPLHSNGRYLQSHYLVTAVV